MLTRLYVSNIILIDRLEIEFSDGLTVMTGETGAGKSILLDALMLALGGKGDADLIRSGAASATVVAEFSAPDGGDTMMLKRVMTLDGKSKCYINDEPVTQKALKELGDELVEIHGQFANHGLLDEKTHIHSLDAFAGARDGYRELTDGVKQSYADFHDAEKRLKELRELLDKAAGDREFLEHNIKELESLNPRPGEEEALSDARANMMNAEKNAGILKDAAAIIEQGFIAEKIFNAAHILERTKSYQPQIDKLYEIGGAVSEIADAIKPDAFDAGDLEMAEERLFALRAAARKHRVGVDELPAHLEKMRGQLNAIDDSDGAVKKLSAEVLAKKSEYEKFANALTRERIAAAAELRALMKKELPDLKLAQADFSVDIKSAPPSAGGSDSVTFMIRTNPGMPFDAIGKIASGGELARLMLALRVVLANGAARTLIFDEIDTGISGATAAAVGSRLAALTKRQQAIVVTHSAQVAGYGGAHLLISKNTDGKTTTTSVAEISGAARVNEIARIISGAKITDDAIKAAKTLLKH